MTSERRSTWKRGAAIEAVVLAATEPVPPAVLAQLVELPTDARRGALRRARRPSTSARAAASSSPASPAATASRPTPTRTRTSSGSCSRARPPGSSGPVARDARDRRVQAADLAGAALGDPRRQRRRDAEDARRARLRRGESATSPTPGNPIAVRHDHARSSSGSGSTRSTSCRRSPTSCPTRRWSRRSSAACGCATTHVDARRAERAGEPSRVAADAPAELAASCSRPRRRVTDEGERLQKVLARARASDRGARAKMLIADGSGRRSTARSRSSARRVDPGADAHRGRRRPGRRRHHARALAAEQAGRLRHDRADPQGRPTVVELVPGRAARVPGRPARPRHRRAAAPHQRRRARPAAHAPEPRRREGVPRRGRRRPDRRRAPRAARRRRARRRPDAPGAVRRRAATRATATRAGRDRGEGRSQTHGAPHVRGGRPSGARGSCARASARSRDPNARAGGVAGAHARRGAGALRRRRSARPRSEVAPS